MSGESGGNVAKSSSGSCPARADATGREGALDFGESGDGGDGGDILDSPLGSAEATPKPPPPGPDRLPAAPPFFFFFVGLFLFFEAANAVDCKRG